MRFIVDENVPRHVLNRLRADGMDVTLIAGTRSGIADREVLKVTLSEDRVLITADKDFGELVVRHRFGACGVIVFQLERLANPAKADRIAEVIAVHVQSAYRSFADHRTCAYEDPPPGFRGILTPDGCLFAFDRQAKSRRLNLATPCSARRCV